LAIVDSGFSPLGVTAEIFDSFKNNDYITYDQKTEVLIVLCKDSDKIPSISFKLNGNSYTIPSANFIVPSGVNEYCMVEILYLNPKQVINQINLG